VKMFYRHANCNAIHLGPIQHVASQTFTVYVYLFYHAVPVRVILLHATKEK